MREVEDGIARLSPTRIDLLDLAKGRERRTDSPDCRSDVILRMSQKQGSFDKYPAAAAALQLRNGHLGALLNVWNFGRKEIEW